MLNVNVYRNAGKHHPDEAYRTDKLYVDPDSGEVTRDPAGDEYRIVSNDLDLPFE